MKSFGIILSALILTIFSSVSFAQLKIGYVDSNTIMDNLPDAQDARQKLDALVKEWQDELNKKEADWKTKYDDYEKRKLIMTDQTRSETETELMNMEKDISDYREKKFGTNGELFQKQDELMKPVQNKIFTAIQDIAQDENLDFVFDRSGDVMLLYAKEEYDITNKVLDKLKLE
ncbi:MAG TPA: OmpH family outer membrane protein [Ignavibacteriaceae bacterium]|nr:OmpH family outer membrane protein [Ignavibacteriaceae bacterium]